jgi:type II secretory pathway pseudopilin PulG
MRRGTSLVEVLVATVLLAVGIAGTLGSLAAAARLRTAARAQERVGAVAVEAFSNFVADGCAISDSLVTDTTDGPQARVRVVRLADRASLELDVLLDVPLLRARVRIESEHPCT